MKIAKLRAVFPPVLTIFILAALYFNKPEPYQAISNTMNSFAPELVSPATTSKDDVSQVPKRRASLSVIFDRPLFSNTRRNPAPQKVVKIPEVTNEAPSLVIVKDPKLDPPELVIVGMIKRGANPSVLLRGQNFEKWYKLGDTVLKWKIMQISNHQITLKYKDQETSIQITR